ncbi:flavin reductase [Methylopila henanensis]|uniref:Flavin reductase n=1 Tax=Methylopila henanensis TaxID=873516 RepID=A0ABW4K6B5_9HYPH
MTVTDKNAARFREAMSRVPMAVHVVTTDGPGGRHGATATAVASVTDAPPTLLVCLNRTSAIAAKALANGLVAVSALGEDHEPVARAFARSSGGRPDDRFDVGRWERRITGAPVLVDAIASFEGRVTASHEVGSHVVLMVELDGVSAPESEREGLLYRRRAYASAAEARAVDPADA